MENYFVLVKKTEAIDQQQSWKQISDNNSTNMDHELQGHLIHQPVGNLPKIVAVVSAASQQPLAACQSSMNSPLVLQSLQSTPEFITLMSNVDQQSASEIPSFEVSTANNSDDCYGEQDMIVESVQAEETKVVIVQGQIEEDDNDDEISVTNSENVSPNKSMKRSASNENVELVKSKRRHASTEMKFRAFDVNWSKIGDHILERLNCLQEYRNKNPGKHIPVSTRLSKTDMTTLTNTIVDQLRCIDTEIPACTMDQVAKQIYSKFSGLQFIDDDGCANQQSYVALKHKMINRNSYLNRFKSSDGPSSSVAEVRRNKNVKAGTLKEYWTASSSRCDKKILSELLRDDPKLLSDELLLASQPYVRFRMDEPKPLKEIITGFPVLRRRQLISFHFEKATGVAKDLLEKLFIAKREKIVDFLRHRFKNTLDETPSDYTITASLCSLLGENINELIIQKELGTKASEITTESAGPMLIAVDLGNDHRVFYAFAEQTQLTEGTKDIFTALGDLLAVHYVYNFMYMKSASKFLEFLQTYFFKICPLTGTKSKASRKSKQQRLVQSIIEALSNHVPQATPDARHF